MYYRVDIYCITYSAVWSFSAVRFGCPVFIYSAVQIRPSGLDPYIFSWGLDGDRVIKQKLKDSINKNQKDQKNDHRT